MGLRLELIWDFFVGLVFLCVLMFNVYTEISDVETHFNIYI